MKQLLILLFFLVGLSFTQAQNKWEAKLKNNTFVKPLKIPMLLSGNFCELRSNHFHGGLDIKTQGVEGHDIQSIEAGYVVRIKISAYGYGNALYINHPKSGVTSVYAHLQSFSPKIKAYIQKVQKQKKRNSIDHTLEVNALKVSRGELIGLSGNSGGSLAPHLHFELRDANNQHPINPGYAFHIKDDVKPDIGGLMVYDLSQKRKGDILNRKKYAVHKVKNGEYLISDTIATSPNIGFGVKAYDRATGASNQNGFYKMDFFIDNKPVWGIKMDEYSYGETRYINSLVDYPFFKKNKQRFVKLFKDPNNKLKLFTHLENNGQLEYEAHKTYNAQVVVTDIKGNISILNWCFTTSKPFLESVPKGNYQINYNEDLTFNHEGVEMSFSSKSLYTDLDLNIAYQDKSIPSFVIEPTYTPIHQRINVKVECPDTLKARIDKVCITQLVGKRKSYIKPKVNRLNLDFRIRSFGKFSFDTDEDDPYVTFPHLKENGNASKHNRITIKAYDLQSGIKRYNAKLDGNWVILEYNPKKRSFYHYFENKPNQQKHVFEIEIIDNCSNKKIIKRNFVR